MRIRIDAHSVANTVRMARTVRRDASALLVEGSKDVRVYRNFVDEQACDVFPAEGKSNALDALGLLRASGDCGVLVIVDADFSAISGGPIQDPDIVATDAHDLECMLVQSPALAKLLIEYDLAPGQFGPDLAANLAKAVQPLGYLRLASDRFGLRLDFKDLAFSVFTRPGLPLELDSSALVREVARRNPACERKPDDLREMIERLVSSTHDPWAVACGHDVTALLALLLSRNAQRPVPAFTVERQLRLSFEAAHFKQTRMHARIREWEHRNPRYRVLRDL